MGTRMGMGMGMGMGMESCRIRVGWNGLGGLGFEKRDMEMMIHVHITT